MNYEYIIMNNPDEFREDVQICPHFLEVKFLLTELLRDSRTQGFKVTDRDLVLDFDPAEAKVLGNGGRKNDGVMVMATHINYPGKRPQTVLRVELGQGHSIMRAHI